ncbi:MAG: DUF962 domain-containing protein [Rubrivivax sp.]|jgi:uncharacterized membrane protein YGL010W|nr:DUF962 domain-containing protein [Rubrivivax sp.]
MRSLEDQLSAYAAYHRDRRNIATHFVGVPMIVLAVTVLLSRPSIDIAGLALSPAVLAIVVTSLYYLRLDRPLGALMTGLLVLSGLFGAWAAALPTPLWLAVGLGGFVVGWVIQFVGHVWEGRKPAFVDDLMGLIIGPLFVTVEALFLMGRLPALKAVIEGRVGPTRAGPAQRQAAA